MKHFGDITKISGYDLSPVDIVTGGSPCQDLSVAGKTRPGLAGERSGLFMEQIRVIKEMRERDRNTGRTGESIRPRYMVWENVPGCFSSGIPKGEDFRIVLEETARIADPDVVIPRPENGKWKNAGAVVGDGWSLAWRVHNSEFWGVAQRRRRVSLVADFGGGTAPEICFEQKSVYGIPEPREEDREGASSDTGRGAAETNCETRIGLDNHPADSRVTIAKNGVYQTLPSRMGTGGGERTHGSRTMIDETALSIGNGQRHQISLAPVARPLDCMHDQQIILIRGGATCGKLTEGAQNNAKRSRTLARIS